MSQDIDKYLQGEQAREDVSTLIEQDKQRPFGKIERDGMLLEIAQSGAWTEVMFYAGQSMMQAFYHRSDDAFFPFTISDRMHAMAASALRTHKSIGRLMSEILRLTVDMTNNGDFVFVEQPSLTIVRVHEKHLPSAICRVLLASYRVATL